MIPRLLKLPEKHSFFLFGARGTGKSTLLNKFFHKKSHSLFIDLLNPEVEERLIRTPNELIDIVKALPKETTHIVLDEIQKVPKLLDVVHILIESTNKKFILTGSSARKLKHGGANLLAGRAFFYNLFPFSFLELDKHFQLQEALQWGFLPKVFEFSTNEEKQQFLQSYSLTYLKEEIWAEQFIRELDPFRYFLEVAAQMNGKIINFSKIANDVGVDDKTIVRYYSILEDTLIGFFLQPFHHSFRKRLSHKPKFYFVDGGINRALSRTLSMELIPSTSAYGEAFEQMVIIEIIKLVAYFNSEYRLSYLKTKDDAEIDLVVERPGKPLLFIEIKSNRKVEKSDLSTFIKLIKDFDDCEAVCFSNDPYRKIIDKITIMPWQEGIKNYFQ